ncbi:hypothetical protein BDV12DRAFT_192109 [Aspergillus spectabilis]
MVSEKQIVIEGQSMVDTLWDHEKITRQGVRISGPCIITELDSKPGCCGEIDFIGNILIRPVDGDSAREQPEDKSAEAALETVQSTPLIPTLVAPALASIRSEMDTLMLRCSMSPAIREQQDEFNVITTPNGKMLVGQFGSFITQFLRVWKGTIEEGDVFITNDTRRRNRAGKYVNQCDAIFDDGVQIPCIKLYAKGAMNTDFVDLLCRNSRQPDWYRSGLMAIIAACRTAASRACELVVRFRCEVYLAALL